MGALRWAAAIAALVGCLTVPFMAEAKGGKGCAALHDACESAGFSASQKMSKAPKIVRDCMNPLMSGVTPPGNGILPLPQVDKSVIAACQAAKAKTGKAGKPGIATGQKISTAPAAPKALPTGKAAGPNIVMILVDDFSLDLMTTKNGVLAEAMPNLAQMMKEGTQFSNYFVTDSLCCPSRSSIFTGLMPHNTGVTTNTGATGGYNGFMSNKDDTKTFAVALHDGSYATSMMGKFLNGYDIKSPPTAGWTDWAVAANGYANFNYSLNQNGVLTTPALHMTDQLSLMGQDFIKASADGPFFLELSTFSPHAPYTPPARYADAFPDLTYPQNPAYNARPDKNAPQWLQDIPPLDKRFAKKIDEFYRMRVQSSKGIDDMIGDVRNLLNELGLASDTYVIFTSDNGYHMGEYSLRAGKMTPFDSDIHVPLVVVGPGVGAGKTVDDIAMNIDLYPTFVDLAGLAVSQNVDGQSLAPLLRGEAVLGRTMAVVEHAQAPQTSDDPDKAEPKAGDPPTYVALRLRDALFVDYVDTGEVGYYDLSNDPYALKNIAGSLSADRLKALKDAVQANHACSGTKECGAAQSLKP